MPLKEILKFRMILVKGDMWWPWNLNTTVLSVKDHTRRKKTSQVDNQMSEPTEVGVISHCLVEGLIWPTDGSDEVLAVAGGLQPVDNRTVRQAVNRDGNDRVVFNSSPDLTSSTQH